MAFDVYLGAFNFIVLSAVCAIILSYPRWKCQEGGYKAS